MIKVLVIEFVPCSCSPWLATRPHSRLDVSRRLQEASRPAMKRAPSPRPRRGGLGIVRSGACGHHREDQACIGRRRGPAVYSLRHSGIHRSERIRGRRPVEQRSQSAQWLVHQLSGSWPASADRRCPVLLLDARERELHMDVPAEPAHSACEAGFVTICWMGMALPTRAPDYDSSAHCLRRRPHRTRRVRGRFCKLLARDVVWPRQRLYRRDDHRAAERGPGATFPRTRSRRRCLCRATRVGTLGVAADRRDQRRPQRGRQVVAHAGNR
jgi:hypothetical protein